MIDICSNCHQEKTLKTVRIKRCGACDTWLRKNGEERPQWRYTNHCLNCGLQAVPRTRPNGTKERSMVKGRCLTCYKYWIDNKKERPKRLYNRDENLCKNPNCKRPLHALKHINGQCPACRSWELRHKKNRPKVLCFRIDKTQSSPRGYNRFDLENIADAPVPESVLGWCDCGEIATRQIIARMNRANNFDFEEQILLCKECYQIELAF